MMCYPRRPMSLLRIEAGEPATYARVVSVDLRIPRDLSAPVRKTQADRVVDHLGFRREELEGEVVATLGYRCNFVRDLLHLSLELSRLELWWLVAEIFLVMLWLC